MWRNLFFRNISTYIEIINQYLSEEYEPKPLNEYFKIVGGYAFKSKEYKTKGIPVIRISDFQNEKIILDNVRYYEESEELKKYELYEGDIIIAMTGGTIGKLAIVQKGLGKLYLNQRVGKFKLINDNLFHEKYVYWIARGVEEKVKSLAWGGAQPNVSSKKIEEMKFPIPIKDVQKNIVEFLSDFEKNKLSGRPYFNKNIEHKILIIQNQCVRIETLYTEIQTQKQLLSQLKQSILQEAIEGKLTQEWRERNPDVEPASELLKRIKAEKQQLIKDKKIRKEKPLPSITEEEIPFDIPESWVWCRVGEIGYTQTGTTPPKNDLTNYGNFIPFIQPSNITSKGLDFNCIGLSKKGLEKGRLISKYSNLMVCIGGSAGKTCYNEVDISCNQQINALTTLSKTNYKYVDTAFKSPYFYTSVWSVIKQGSTPILNKREWSKILLPLAPAEEQKVIVEKVEALMEKCNALEQEITKSETYVNMLMQAVLKEAFENKKEEKNEI